MDYRILELDSPHADLRTGVVVRRFDSAYRAMDALRAAVIGREERAKRWYLLDGRNRILLRPDDVDDLAA